MTDGLRDTESMTRPAPEDVPDILERCAGVYRKKNADYSDSWRKMGAILGDMFPNGFIIQDEDDFTAFFILTRILDKLNRIGGLVFEGDRTTQVNDEAIADTCEDIVNYAAMLAKLERGR